MAKLEYTKFDFDFRKMQQGSKVGGEEYFPKGVKFIEPSAPADFKRECYENYPETYQGGMERGVSLVELLNKRVQNEALAAD